MSDFFNRNKNQISTSPNKGLSMLPGKFFFLFLTLTLLFSAPSSANELSRINGLKLRLIPDTPLPIDGIGTKTIEVSVKRGSIQLNWFSAIRQKIKSTPWPEHKISTLRGMLRTDHIDPQSWMIHPHLWTEGFYHLSQSSLIWFPLETLMEHKKKGITFSPGFLEIDPNLYKKAAPDIFRTVSEFRRVSLKILENSPGQSIKGISKLRSFLNDFSQIKIKDYSKENLVINNQKQKVKTLTIGNDYIDYLVLNNTANPLILAVSFNSKSVPDLFKETFQFFEESMSYKISQVIQ